MVIGPCACGSTEFFAIKPGALAEYGPPLDERGWPDLAATPVLKVAEIPDVFTCRACFLKNGKERRMTPLTITITLQQVDNILERGAMLVETQAAIQAFSKAMEKHKPAIVTTEGEPAAKTRKPRTAPNGATTVLPGAVDLAPRVGKTLAENVR